MSLTNQELKDLAQTCVSAGIKKLKLPDGVEIEISDIAIADHITKALHTVAAMEVQSRTPVVIAPGKLTTEQEKEAKKRYRDVLLAST